MLFPSVTACTGVAAGCAGYEYRDQPMAAYGNCERGVHLALEMLPLSNDITLLTDGEELTASDKVRRAKNPKHWYGDRCSA